MPAFLPFLLLLLALAIVLRVDLYFTIFWFLLGLYAMSRLWTRRAARQIRLQRRFADHAFTGDEVPVDLSVRNAGLLPIPYAELDESIPMELRGEALPMQAISLGAYEERHFGYTLHCRRRGYYPLGPTRVQTGDVLGMEQLLLQAEEPRRLTVYPRIVPLQHLGLPTHSALTVRPTSTPLVEDPTRVVGVRDYRPGDEPRRIHWTATARLNRLVVKQLQPATARETLIYLDLDLDDYPLQRYEAVEVAIVAAASIANHSITQERLAVGLGMESSDARGDPQRVVLPPRTERAQLTTILELLARVQAAPGGHFARLVREESTRLTWGATLVVITGRVGPELGENLLYLKRSGYPVTAILAQPNLQVSAVDAAPIGTRRVWFDRDMAVL